MLYCATPRLPPKSKRRAIEIYGEKLTYFLQITDFPRENISRKPTTKVFLDMEATEELSDGARPKKECGGLADNKPKLLMHYFYFLIYKMREDGTNGLR